MAVCTRMHVRNIHMHTHPPIPSTHTYLHPQHTHTQTHTHTHTHRPRWGTGIAQVTAEKGYRVLLKDKDLAGVSRGQGYIKDNLQVGNGCRF
jgi:hypothetical protein